MAVSFVITIIDEVHQEEEYNDIDNTRRRVKARFTDGFRIMGTEENIVIRMRGRKDHAKSH